MQGRRAAAFLIAAIATACVSLPAPAQGPATPSASPRAAQQPLRPVADFASVTDPQARSLALFAEAAKVLTHPRCVNCHPATERPLQGDLGQPHQPKIVRGEAGMGPAGLACSACHGAENVTLVGVSLKSVPGHPEWHLAPPEMAWEGKSQGAICEQIKDPARNGGKDLAALHDHAANDGLVGWGWAPGEGRTPAPGTQAEFGALIKAWIDTGAHCPRSAS